MSEAMTIPSKLQEIIDDFSFAEGREKLELLLEFAEQMPPLPDWLAENRDSMDQVRECMTPVFIHAETNDSGMTFFFDVPEQSPTVRGYAALMAEGLQGAAPAEVMNIPGDFYRAMGLHEVLSYQRLNGITAILAYMKRLAVEAMSKT